MNGPNRVPWSFAALAGFATLAHGCLLLGWPVPPWLLLVAMLGAALWARPRLPEFGWPVWLVVGGGTAAVAYGCLATTDRVWDGFATWTASARWLAVDGSLEHAWFRDPDAARVGRGYPLLQPLVLAQTMQWFGERGGRLWFVALWCLLPGLLAGALTQRGVAARWRNLAVAGVALVPLFLEGGPAGADSGYADLLVAVVLLGAAAAVVGNAPGYALAAGLLLPLTKAEGTVLLLLMTAVAAATPRPKAAVGLALGGAIGLLLWAPLQVELARQPFGLGTLLRPLAPLLVGLGLLALQRLGRTTVAALAVVTVLALVGAGAFDATHLGSTVRDLQHLALHWAALPDILARTAFELVSLREVALSFVVLLAAAAVCWRQRRELGGAGPLLVAFGLGVLAVIVFVLSKPPATTDSFLRQGVGRYLAHWLGVAWLCTALLLQRLAEPAAPGSRSSGAEPGAQTPVPSAVAPGRTEVLDVQG